APSPTSRSWPRTRASTTTSCSGASRSRTRSKRAPERPGAAWSAMACRPRARSMRLRIDGEFDGAVRVIGAADLLLGRPILHVHEEAVLGVLRAAAAAVVVAAGVGDERVEGLALPAQVDRLAAVVLVEVAARRIAIVVEGDDAGVLHV